MVKIFDKVSNQPRKLELSSIILRCPPASLSPLYHRDELKNLANVPLAHRYTPFLGAAIKYMKKIYRLIADSGRPFYAQDLQPGMMFRGITFPTQFMILSVEFSETSNSLKIQWLEHNGSVMVARLLPKSELDWIKVD